ncbi:MAG: hypothetical protein EOO41_02705 [Methanobacteriota archaeon]|nr:MAG: hypothetical protein EOO41_02705 [Euryarchaeota archaeon]
MLASAMPGPAMLVAAAAPAAASPSSACPPDAAAGAAAATSIAGPGIADASMAGPAEPGTILATLTKTLREIVRSGIGLPTRGATARFIRSLVLNLGDRLKPHAMHLMRAVQAALEDPSPSLRKEFAHAAASLSRVCKSGTLQKYVAHLLTLASKGDGDTARHIAGFAMKEVAHASLERVKTYFSDIIPAAFLVRTRVSLVRTAAFAYVRLRLRCGASCSCATTQMKRCAPCGATRGKR